MKSEELLPAVEQGLATLGESISGVERKSIEAAADGVREALRHEPHDVNGLNAANQALDTATEAMAAQLVEMAMEAALAQQLEGGS